MWMKVRTSAENAKFKNVDGNMATYNQRVVASLIPDDSGLSKMKFSKLNTFPLIVLTIVALTSSSCVVGKFPPDEHNKVAKPLINNFAAADPLGVLLSGNTTIKTDQTYNPSNEMLEGGTDTQLISSLPDYSTQELAHQVAMHMSLVNSFTAPIDSELGFDSSKLPPVLWTEHGTLLNRSQRMLFRLQTEKPQETNPLMYIEQLGLLLYAPLVLDYAPTNDRMAAIIQRLNKTPAYLETAKENLRSTSGIRKNAAQEATDGVIGLIRNVISEQLAGSLSSDFNTAIGDAVAALEDYKSFLGGRAANDDWRAGSSFFGEKLQLETAYPLPDLATILKDAEGDFAEAHDALISAAEPINRRIYGGSRPRNDYRLINDVLEVLEGENRARNNQGMMSQMEKDTDEARKICNEEELAPVPEELQLTVVETPEFMRISVPLAGGFGPSASTGDNNALVWLTPAPPDASRAEQRDRLTTNNIYQLKLLALRYGIPGYALIGAISSQMETDQHKLTHLIDPLPAFYNGWPIYVTETTVEAAYTGDVDFIWLKYKLQTIGAAMVDLQLHTGNMSTSGAVEFLTRRAYMESSAARALVRSMQVNPTTSTSTYLGWKGWQMLREHYQETTQDFSLTSFHGKALQTGSMPLIEFSYAVSEAKGRLSFNTGDND